ncbi:rhodanese-like domain-containing protein [Clostridioides sp. ES-S-0001-03]
MSKKLREEIEEGFCANVKSISTEDLKEKVQDESWVIVDTRLNDAYNGWKLDGVKRGGHIRGAVDFSANWLYVDSDKKDKVLEQALKTKGIDLDKNIVLYDANGKDALLVATYLSKKGYKNLYKYDIKQWANNENLPMERYKNYQMIVPASIIKDILDGKIPETFEYSKNIKMIEASWGEEKESYAKGHIPTSVHINTDIIEPPPTWMLTNNDNLAKFALDYGFTKDDTVIVSSSASMASYRIAII